MQGGLSVVPLTTYLGQLGYTELFLGTIRLGWDLWGSVGKTLELLLTTHFPISEVIQEMAAPAADLNAGHSDWRLPAKVITYRRVEWAIVSFAPYKTPGMDSVYLALLQEGQEVVIPYLIRIFHASLSTGYVPDIW
jgi:hypothetical protein